MQSMQRMVTPLSSWCASSHLELAKDAEFHTAPVVFSGLAYAQGVGKRKPHEVPPPYRRFAGACLICGMGLQWEANSNRTLVDGEGSSHCERRDGRHVLAYRR